MSASAAVERRRRNSQQLGDVIESQPAFLYLFQCGWKQLEAVFRSRHPFCFRNAAMNAIGIRVGSQKWLLLVAGGGLCAMIAHRLLCGPGRRAIESPLRHGTAILSRRHFFVEATVPCVATLAGHSGIVWSVAFHPREQVLATGSFDKTAKVWRMSADCTAATCVATLAGHSGPVLSVAFHPREQVLATGSSDKTAKVWRMSADCTEATCVATLAGHSGAVRSVAFHPREQVLATGSFDQTAKLWK